MQYQLVLVGRVLQGGQVLLPNLPCCAHATVQGMLGICDIQNAANSILHRLAQGVQGASLVC